MNTEEKREPEIGRLMDELNGVVDMLSGAVASLGTRLEAVMSPPSPNKEKLAEFKAPMSPLGNQLCKQIEIIKERTASLNNIINRLEI